MGKYKQIILLVIFGMVSFCALNDVLSVEKSFSTNDTNEDDIEVMLQTLERERAELDKLKLELNGASEIRKDVADVQIEKDVEKKRKVVITNFVKKRVKKKEKVDGLKIITLESEDEVVKESEKVTVDNGGEIIHPFEIAENLYKLGEYETAMDIYKLVIKNDVTKDKKMWISYQIANCYRKQGLNNEAVEAYKEMQKTYEGTYWAKQSEWYVQDIKWRTKVEKQVEKVARR